MEDTINYYKRKKEFHVFVANSFSELQKFKKENDKIAFNNLLLKALPEVKRYINKRLVSAIAKGNIPQGKYKSDDFTDQLFIETYDHFDEVATEKDLHPWLFKKADELLGDTVVDEMFNDLFFKNIDDYSKPEWDEMEEKFSTDGDGDLVMIEELDDISYKKNDYILNHVFVEDSKNEITAKLDKELDEENIRKHTNMVLHHLPLPMRTVFELFTEHHFDLDEVTKIMGRSVQEVEQLLEEARKSLEISLFNRFGP